MARERPVSYNRKIRSAGSGQSETASLSMREVFWILRRHVFLIFILTLLGLAAGGGAWFLLRTKFPRYTAGTRIQVLPPDKTDPLAIGTMQLQSDVMYRHRQSIANFITQHIMIEQLLATDVVKKTSWYNGFKGTQTEKDRQRVRYLKKNFRAYTNRNSDFVEITMSCGQAQEAAEIVNEMLRLFLEKQDVSEQSEIADKMRELEERKGAVQAEYNATEKELDNIRATEEIADLERPLGNNFQHTITIRLNNLELQKDELSLMIRQLEAELDNLQKMANSPVTEQVDAAIEKDPAMMTLSRQLSFLEAELSGKLSRFGEQHRDVKRLRSSIEKTQQEKENRKTELAEQTTRANLKNVQDKLIVLSGRYEALEKSRREVEAEKKQLDLARVRFENAMKVRDERLSNLDDIKAQIEKLKVVQANPKTPTVLSIGDAPRPLEILFTRQWWLWIPSGTILGLLMGIVCSFLVELANDLLRTPRDVDRYVSVPLLGVIPNASEDRQARRVNPAHVVRRAPYSITSEAYRRCRTNLKLSGSTESNKTLLVTSGMTGDGKTSVAVNLASCFVASGKSVLLVDANFRKPQLDKLFPKEPIEDSAESFEFGLSSVLTHQCAPGEAVRSSGIEGLDIVDCGPAPAHPADLLGSSRMEELLREQRRNYDYIIIDGPPILLVSDSKILAGFVDSTVPVFNANATSRGAARRTIRELREVDAEVAGSILFGARSIKGGYFREQFRSYKKYHKSARLAVSSA